MIVVIMETRAVGLLVSFRTDDRFGVVGSVVSLLLALVVGIRLLFAHEKCLASSRCVADFRLTDGFMAGWTRANL